MCLVQQLQTEPHVFLPGSTIGILGGGQLGRMTILAGRALGYRFVVLDPVADAPAAQVADRQIIAPYDNRTAARELAEAADVITYEFENVDAAVAAVLERESVVPQGSALLHTTQHRLREKRAIQATGAAVTEFCAVRSERELADAAGKFQWDAFLKTTTGGYDGKGQWRITPEADVSAMWADVLAHLGPLAAKADSELEPLIVERRVPFVCEISVVVARSTRGEIRSLPVVENIHRNGILHQSIVPARIPPEVALKALAAAENIALGLNMVGTLAVEMFVTADGEVLVNELAPRPHNSGHWSIEASVTSQFEQHLRAILGLPLGDTTLLTPVVMVNLLGQHVERLDHWLERLPTWAKLHLYGKADAKQNRKMGHITLLNSIEQALDWTEKSAIWTP